MAAARKEGVAYWCPANSKPSKISYYFDSGQGGPRDGCIFKKTNNTFLELANCTENKHFFCIVCQKIQIPEQKIDRYFFRNTTRLQTFAQALRVSLRFKSQYLIYQRLRQCILEE